jgi:hypothetical protein
VGIFYANLNAVERAILILAASTLVVFPIGFTSWWWVAAVLLAGGVLTRNYRSYRKANSLAA